MSNDQTAKHLHVHLFPSFSLLPPSCLLQPSQRCGSSSAAAAARHRYAVRPNRSKRNHGTRQRRREGGRPNGRDRQQKEEESADGAAKKKKSKKKGKKKKGKGDTDGALKEDENALSEEDQELKDRLETCVSTVTNEKNEAAVTVPLRLQALDVIVTELRSATSSMTSVPKPLKFLRPHFDTIKKLHGSIDDDAVKADVEMLTLRARLADVLSVLAMTMGKHGKYSDTDSIT